MNKKLHSSWQKFLSSEFEKDYMINLQSFLKEEKVSNQIIFPESENYFKALNITPFDKVKVVILGQDPYHGMGQANGLSFSVPQGIKIPPSLKNIYKELNSDLGINSANHGCLLKWAEQGVLLLNSVLSVRSKEAGSHQNKGWEQFTDQVILNLNEHRSNIVYMLWGNYAQKKGSIINAKNNLILKSVHPSPLSAHRGFLGCKHFTKCNQYLSSHQINEIDWRLD